MHTARRAAASIGQGFDHRFAAGRDFVSEVDGRRLGEGGFCEAQYLGTAIIERAWSETGLVAWLGMSRDGKHRDAIRELGRPRSQLTVEQREAAKELHQEVAESLTH